MKTIYFICLFFCVSGLSQAQQDVPGSTHLPRSGDEFFKQDIPWFSPGKSGSGIVWDFSRIPVSEAGHRVMYFSLGDALVASESESLSFYSISGDSLLLRGEENAASIIRYHTPQMLLQFPLSVNSTTAAPFVGKGKIGDRIEIQTGGTVRSQVDGSGTLILPAGDTLKQAIRVHISKTFSSRQAPLPAGFQIDLPGVYSQEASLDSAQVETDCYLWFAPGYRYPVLESIEIRTLRAGQTAVKEQKASLFLPLEQVAQVPDLLHDALHVKKEASEVTAVQTVTAGLRVYPNPVKDLLQIFLSLTNENQVQIRLYDLVGKILYQSSKKVKSGSFNETIPMSSFPKGTYLLRVQTGEKLVTEKIIKL